MGAGGQGGGGRASLASGSRWRSFSEEMSEGELGFREAANPNTWIIGTSMLSVLPPGFVVCVFCETPPPTHMLLE